jgi:hypothetical protein
VYSAPRLWWTLRIFGHENVSVLDGGLSKWAADGHELETSEVDERCIATEGLAQRCYDTQLRSPPYVIRGFHRNALRTLPQMLATVKVGRAALFDFDLCPGGKF